MVRFRPILGRLDEVKQSMSETNRRKKDGENRDHANARMENQAVDQRQNVDRPDVAESRTGDSFDADLKRDSAKTKRGQGNATRQTKEG